MSTRLVVFATILALSGRATAEEIDHGAPGAVELRAPVVATRDAGRQRALTESRAWQDFRARHGHWNAVWNEATASPHLAFGEAIRLDGPTGDAAQADRAVRRFIGGHPELFGTPRLETVRSQRVGRVWYVSYRQTVHGVPVLFEDWEFRVGADGRLMSFGADAHRIPAAVATRPALVAAAAREAARSGLSFDPATDRSEGGETLYLLPYPDQGGIEYRLVYDVRVSTVDPPHSWATFVDAMTGDVLWRRDQVYSVISGHVSGYIHPFLPTDPLVVRPFAHENVVVGGTTVATDANGAYSAPVSGPSNVTTRLSGPFADVIVDGQPRTSFTATGQPDGSTVDVLWTSSREQDALVDAAERDAFYHMNVVHDYEKAIDPAFTQIDVPVRGAIYTNFGCGAFVDTRPPITIVLGGAKTTSCPPTASMPDAIYHEYGHVVNHLLYTSLGALPFGMLSGELHEGTSDVLASMIRNDPIIGNGLHGLGTFIRRVDVPNRWPEDRNHDGHSTGLILAAAFWDLSRTSGVDLAARLSHFAKYGLPDDPNDPGVAMAEYFVQTLVADDNDHNLANGTPHFAAINAAFDAHGIGTGYFVNIAHTPLADQAGSGPFPVSAAVTFDAASLGFGRLDVTSPTLYYSINGAPFVAQTLMRMGTDQFAGSIPAAPAAIVRYYFEARDASGGRKSMPAGAPANAHQFVTGIPTTLLLADMETNPNWNTGQASEGKWQRDDPVGTFYYYNGGALQPELDHTPAPGTKCFFTDANSDVDGISELTTSAFSAAGVANPAIEYFRWFVWAGESISEDTWSTDISNDGGATWVNVERFTQSDASWRRVVFPIASRVTPTSNMRMRFVAHDAGFGSNLEAAVDDFRVISLAAGQSAAAAARARADGAVAGATLALALRVEGPNPSRHESRVSFTLPERGTVDLAVFDLGGRRLRDLVRGVVEPGQRQAIWDGLDRAGHPVASGVYFARLEYQGRVLSSVLVRMR